MPNDEIGIARLCLERWRLSFCARSLCKTLALNVLIAPENYRARLWYTPRKWSSFAHHFRNGAKFSRIAAAAPAGQGELYWCDSSHLTFIRNKTFDWAKHGLLSPSQEMYSLCSNVEKVVQMNIEKLSSGRNIMQNLKDCVSAVLDLRTFKIGSLCDEHL